MEFETVIGLEVHAQLSTQSKIFCSCSTEFGAPPNTHVCPVCMGMPGVLPKLNKKVVEYAIRMALATHCEINQTSRFARKNYFYPDLPKNYQISQFELPIAEHGWVHVETKTGREKIGITRIHMEEDAGKLVHDPVQPVSRVDLNRTGTPLLEIVSEPDMRSPAQAGAYLKKLHAIVRYLDICDGNMDQGSFRCDANVSVRPRGQKELGTRTEVKNMNSFKNVERALAHEIDRQIAVIEDGGEIVQETRLWNADASKTESMRGKEEAHDYRYLPDPDLLPLEISDQWIEDVRGSLPELPDQRRHRFMESFDLSEDDARTLTSSRDLADFFEQGLAVYKNPKPLCNWITSSLLALLNAQDLDISQSPIQPQGLAELLALIDDGTISGKIAKTVFEDMAETGKAPKVIVEEKGLVQVSDTGALEAVVDEVIAENPNEVEAFKGGKKKLQGFFVGQVMKKTKGKANPKMVNQLLGKKLS